jgi:xanthine dehydrogenase small subunit
MTQGIRVLMGGEVRTVPVADPCETVLEWLRRTRRVGTKEGCAEGDCGACTVVLGEERDGRLRYRAVNACIQFLPTLDGRQLITVEDLKGPDGALHPVQQAMVDAHGSQCGFCTPGIVMSLFALRHEAPGADREAAMDALAGNLCRCTGYRPILDAAATMGTAPDAFDAREGATLALLRSIRRDGALAVETEEGRFHAPRTVDELAAVLVANPDATILAGGTDVGLWVTKQHRRLDPVVFVGEVADLATIVEGPDAIDVGAGASWTDVMPVLARHWPSLGELLRRFASVQIRNTGTLGGNVANGSPIGDGMPALIALGATLVFNRGGERREIAIEDHYLAYRRTTLRSGEFLERVRIPLPRPDQTFVTYKVSKRFDQDISAVCAAFRLTRGPDGTVTDFRAGYGGMAAIPFRARGVEAAVVGRPWGLDAVTAAMAAAQAEMSPIDDMRASAAYRRTVARNLLLRFHHETRGHVARVASHG